MMDLLLATSGGESQSARGGYVDDVFSAYTYTGNGATQTINNGIDLAGNGGLVWIKSMSGAFNHGLIDTVRGRGSELHSNTADGADTASAGYGISAFNSNGFSLGQDQYTIMNTNNYTFASWTFRKAPKFFDVVTYTGNGTSNRALSHQLNTDVGMVMVKATSTTGDWWVFHRSATGDLVLNTNAAQTASKANIPSATSSTFTVNGGANTNGVQYVAYLFAHDPSAEGIIQCGGFTHTGVGVNATVNLGWEPQYLLIKGVASSGWTIFDTMRGIISGGVDAVIQPSNSNAEYNATNYVDLIPTGFVSQGGAKDPGDYIYLAIRRPNKPPTSGTQVYNAIARTGTGAAATVTGVGFAPDYLWSKSRATGNSPTVFDRMRGRKFYKTSDTASEFSADNATDPVTSWDVMDGIRLGTDSFNRTNSPGETFIHHFFRRAPGFFDVVCFTGNGTAPRNISHNLGVIPEMLIFKARNTEPGGNTGSWQIRHSYDKTKCLKLETTNSAFAYQGGVAAIDTETTFEVYNASVNNTNYVAYLFATLHGISKVGSYTGNGSSQTINCGFSTVARFVLIKRTDAAGDWYVWDSVRGIVAANDPHLSLNTTAAEVTTDDSIDPASVGFIVNQNTATNINVNGGQYIFLAIA